MIVRKMRETIGPGKIIGIFPTYFIREATPEVSFPVR
jgi:hypothetical protein